MAPKRIIEARDIVNDIRWGMSEAELMEKYSLSSKGLQSAFTKLIEGGIMTFEEIYSQYQTGSDTVTVRNMRTLPRYYLTSAVTIYEPAHPEMRGQLKSVTEKGIGITGIEARIGEIKEFVIPCRDYLEVDEISLEAECRWMVPKKGPDQWMGGFQITKISKTDLKHFRQLVQLAVLKRL